MKITYHFVFKLKEKEKTQISMGLYLHLKFLWKLKRCALFHLHIKFNHQKTNDLQMRCIKQQRAMAAPTRITVSPYLLLQVQQQFTTTPRLPASTMKTRSHSCRRKRFAVPPPGREFSDPLAPSHVVRTNLFPAERDRCSAHLAFKTNGAAASTWSLPAEDFHPDFPGDGSTLINWLFRGERGTMGTEY